MSETSFQRKKRDILTALNGSENLDRSPKGSVDSQILELVNSINLLQGLVTTSSCSGRLSIYVEGQHKSAPESTGQLNEAQIATSIGGKGGGRWLFTSHEPLDLSRMPSTAAALFQVESMISAKTINLAPLPSFIHFKFEPMILHIMASSLDVAQALLSAALNAGFRESGVINVNSAQNATSLPIVAVRSTGMSLDTIIGYQDVEEKCYSMVDEDFLRLLVSVANERFRTNNQRTLRLQTALDRDQFRAHISKESSRETFLARRERKRSEGLAKQQEHRIHKLEFSSRPTDSGDEGSSELYTLGFP